MNNWYKANSTNQGLVIDEVTGKTIAVTYDIADADLVAAAPELLTLLQKAVQYGGLFPDLKQEAEVVIAKAKGELK